MVQYTCNKHGRKSWNVLVIEERIQWHAKITQWVQQIAVVFLFNYAEVVFLCELVTKETQFDDLPRTLRSQVSIYNIDNCFNIPCEALSNEKMQLWMLSFFFPNISHSEPYDIGQQFLVGNMSNLQRAWPSKHRFVPENGGMLHHNVNIFMLQQQLSSSPQCEAPLLWKRLGSLQMEGT